MLKPIYLALTSRYLINKMPSELAIIGGYCFGNMHIDEINTLLALPNTVRDLNRTSWIFYSEQDKIKSVIPRKHIHYESPIQDSDDHLSFILKQMPADAEKKNIFITQNQVKALNAFSNASPSQVKQIQGGIFLAHLNVLTRIWFPYFDLLSPGLNNWKHVITQHRQHLSTLTHSDSRILDILNMNGDIFRAAIKFKFSFIIKSLDYTDGDYQSFYLLPNDKECFFEIEPIFWQHYFLPLIKHKLHTIQHFKEEDFFVFTSFLQQKSIANLFFKKLATEPENTQAQGLDFINACYQQQFDSVTKARDFFVPSRKKIFMVTALVISVIAIGVGIGLIFGLLLGLISAGSAALVIGVNRCYLNLSHRCRELDSKYPQDRVPASPLKHKLTSSHAKILQTCPIQPRHENPSLCYASSSSHSEQNGVANKNLNASNQLTKAEASITLETLKFKNN